MWRRRHPALFPEEENSDNALTSERMVVNLEDGTAQMEGRVRTVINQGSGGQDQ